MSDRADGDGKSQIRNGITTGTRQAVRPARAIPERLEQLEKVGSGGTGVVYKAFDPRMDRVVAVKVAHEHLSHAGQQRFEDEAHMLARLDHPNIPPVYELFEDDAGRCLGFSMKLVEGTTLDGLIRSSRPDLPRDRMAMLIDVLLRVCEAVEFAHDRGVIHRDLNPQNVMVGPHGQVYVMDWGLALDAAEHHSSVSEDVPREWRFSSGTPAYMAPEQARGERSVIDVRTDVFGLGAILYESLTGRPPYAAREILEVVELAGEARIPPPEAVAPSLPAELCRIAMKALAYAPADRYGSAAAFGAELSQFLRAGGWFPRAAFRAGDVIVRQGDHDDAAYMVIEGSCEVFRDADGTTIRLRNVGPGGVFGEVALITGTPRTANVRALTDVTLLVVDKPALLAEMSRAPWLKPFVVAIGERFVELDAVHPGGAGSAAR